MHRTELSSGTSLGKSINEIFVTGNIRNIGCKFLRIYYATVKAYLEILEQI